MAQSYIKKHKVSVRFITDCFAISITCFNYQTKLNSENKLIEDWLLRLTSAHKRWGFGLCFMYLRNVKGFGWNHKRVYRIYRELELNLRIKQVPNKKRQARGIERACIMQSSLVDGFHE